MHVAHDSGEQFTSHPGHTHDVALTVGAAEDPDEVVDRADDAFSADGAFSADNASEVPAESATKALADDMASADWTHAAHFVSAGGTNVPIAPQQHIG